MPQPALGFGLSFSDLYDRRGLELTDLAFLDSLAGSDAALHARLRAARAEPAALTPTAEAELIIALAPHLDDFLAELFAIRAAAAELKERQDALAPLYQAKRQFVQKRAVKDVSAEEAAGLNPDYLALDYAVRTGEAFSELGFARKVLGWLDDEANHAEDLAFAARLAAAAVAANAKRPHAKGVLFKLPTKHDPLAMVPTIPVEHCGVLAVEADTAHLRRREGFNLTDPGTDLAGALGEINYCILCHHQGRDSCSKGMKDKKTGDLVKNAVGVTMEGCPLEEKISEMHEVKAAGHAMAALAVITIDNPMAAGTGHRICNDCMTACVYQNQNRDPVNVPEAETRTLKDVLELPWGFEVYSLLTRWNPLNLRRPLPRPDSGRKVLVVGMGPAGYTLSHHLIQDGHHVVAVDGLKIEPLAAELSGVDPHGRRVAFKPVRDIRALWQPLGERVMGGFGGVAEYGITVRWDKNFLDVIRLLLERRSEFALFGGVRFGGNITLEQAFEAGFDHVALATGAGKPTILDMPNGLARGVRQASDFLMALQLTGAARSATLANLQLRLPVVVIGGGLTAVDTCTEALAYYPIQVEKFLSRYELLVAERGEHAVRVHWSEEDHAIADEFIDHGRAIRAERLAAASEGREPHILELLKSWGGATLVYRRRLTDSPAYRNHEEITKALEEGIRFAEGLTPVAVEVDDFGSASGLQVKDKDGQPHRFPARSILVAAGTVPNTNLARERSDITLDGKYFQAVDEDGNPVKPELLAKPGTPQVLMHVDGFDRTVSFFGDLHPSYAGNVVSAMASAKQGHPVVTRAMARRPANGIAAKDLFARLNHDLRASVHAVERLTPTIVEVVVKAPAAARAFEPGQFFRLQNFEMLARKFPGATLAMEGLALTGAWVDVERGLVGLIVLEMGGSSDLVGHLTPGEPVVLMGPTGAPTHVCGRETVLLAGGGLGNAVLFSIGHAFRAAGSKVLYFAGYKNAHDRFKVADIEAAADVVVWCVDGGEAFTPTRPQDRTFVGNIVEAMVAYGEDRLGPQTLSLKDVDRVIAIGSDRMMAAVAKARHDRLAPWLKKGHTGIGSINSPMQCMLKEVCAQCLQRHKDPVTGEEKIVFTCADQDQPLDKVDFVSLNERLGQNSASEKLGRVWIDRALKQAGLRG
ncbi:pyridine nucleotide-disulfide oxidoreductase [Paramagnetospirillum marisnigri]|uniref:Pyridine nucleotide-disulfide oxidoreductase n=1 Tax=Paramagnetospirillum marisnigri TaxID=1285242 RepID=A0A178MS53_9PROT|nr:FAD-dependent oxidoreductase [Paramagnetospirillum marisnigri]OAN52295.1 pyridine nucleotide-disulfide oxidoreductase [Paramagnetospirillum marisnigri]